MVRGQPQVTGGRKGWISPPCRLGMDSGVIVRVGEDTGRGLLWCCQNQCLSPMSPHILPSSALQDVSSHCHQLSSPFRRPCRAQR